MTRIKINCPVTWFRQCDWIYKNCKEWHDETCWAAWQIGYDDIYFLLNNRDAMMFYLMWNEHQHERCV